MPICISNCRSVIDFGKNCHDIARYLMVFHVIFIVSPTFPDKLSDIERIEDVCQRIRNGAYTVPQSNDKKPSRQKGIVDHYHQVVYCDIGKTGSTSWYSVFSSIIKREKHSRKQLYYKYNYRWYNSRQEDRYR